MTTVVVCLRSRLVSEAVAAIVTSTGPHEGVACEPAAVGASVAAADAVIGLVVDAETSHAVAGPVGCPVVVLGRREHDAGGLERVVTGLPPDVGSAALIDALAALADGTPASRPTRGPGTDRGRRVDDGPDVLTPREQEVLELIAGAASPTDIAAALDVSEHTVRTHVQNLLAKLGATSKVDAVARARTLGLLGAGRSR